MTWETTNLNDPAFEVLNGLWKGKKGPFVRAKVIRNTNFRNDGRLSFADIAELDVEEKALTQRRLVPGDIIIERSGGGPKQPVGRVCFFEPVEDGVFSFSNFTSTLRVKDRRKFNPQFVCYYLLFLYRQGETENLQRATTGIRNLDFTAYKELRIPCPPLETQSSISAILCKIQQAIEVESNLIRVSREFKAAVMNQLFTKGLNGEPQKETEIGLVPESWEICPIGKYLDIKHGYAFDGTFFKPRGELILMTPGNFFEEGGFRDQGERTKYYVGDVPNGYLLEEGALLIAMTEQKAGLIGSAAFVPASNTYLHNQRLGLVINLDKKLDKRFLYHLLNTPSVRTELAKTSTGSKVKHTSPTKIKSVHVAIPIDISEQEEIASILDSIDAAFSVRNKVIAALENLFSSTLTKLMSAEIRVTDLDIKLDQHLIPAQGAVAA